MAITCDDNGCSGTYVGLEFDSTKRAGKTDVAHQFSNEMCDSVGVKLKELFNAGKYKKVDFSKIEMTTVGMDQKDDVTYYLKIPFIDVTAKCDAYTSFDHSGGWGHVPELDKRKAQLASALLPGEQLDISDLKTTPEGLQEYWIQWKNKKTQVDCAKPPVAKPALPSAGTKVKVSGTLKGKSWDDLHTFSTKNKGAYGARMHASDGYAGGYVTDAMEKFYKDNKLNPCVTEIMIKVDPTKMEVYWEVTIEESPDGKAYTAISSWGGADAIYPKRGPAPSRAYDNYTAEKKSVTKRHSGAEIKDMLDFWFPGGFRQIFFQYTRPKEFPALAKSSAVRTGKVGAKIGAAGSPEDLPEYNGLLMPTVEYDNVLPKDTETKDSETLKEVELEAAVIHKNKKSDVKFKLTVSNTVSNWTNPPFDPDNIQARNDLDTFYIFVGDEATAGDPFSDFDENDYDQLDPEYIEIGADGLSPEEYDIVNSVAMAEGMTVDDAAQAVYGSYDPAGNNSEVANEGTEANPSVQEGWSGNVRWGMKVKTVNITVAGRTVELKIWNTQVVGGEKALNLLKCYTAGGESKNSYCAYSWGSSGNSLSESVFGFNQDGSPRTSKFPNKSPLGSKCITDFTWQQICDLGLRVKKPGVFAIGKYQNLVRYIRGHIKKDKKGNSLLDANSYASPKDQEKLGELTIKKWGNLNNYIRGNNKGTEANLSDAIKDTGQCWASLPTTKRGHSVEKNPGYNGAVYGGQGQNPSTVSKNIGMSAIVLIETRKAITGKDPDWLPSWYKPLGIDFQDF